MTSFKRSMVLTFAAYMGVILLDRGAGFVVAYALRRNPGDKGALELIGNLGFILMSLGNLGLATSLVYFLRRKLHGLRAVVETTFAMGGLVGTGLAAATIAGAVLVAHLSAYSMPALHLLVPAVAVVPLLLCTSYLNSAQVAVGRVEAYNLVNLIPSLLFLPFFLVLFLTGTDAVASSIWSRALVTVLAFLAVFFLVRRLLKFVPRLHGSFLRPAVGYGWRANVMSLFTVLGHRLDLYLVWLLVPGPLNGADGLPGPPLVATGIYGFSVTMAELVWHLPESMRDIFFSRVAGHDEEEARAFTPVVVRNLFLLSLLGGVLVWGPGTWLARLIFADLVGDGGCLRLLLPGAVAYVAAKIIHFDLAGRGRINLGILCTGLTLAVMVLFDWLLIPGWGAEGAESGAKGAALASMIAYVVTSVFSVLLYCRVAGVGVGEVLLPRRSDLVHYRAVWEGILRRIHGTAKGGG